MSAGSKWDLTSKSSMDAATEWLRKKSGALLVLVIRSEEQGMSFAVDHEISPTDACRMVDYVLPDLKQQLADERAAAKAEAERKKREKDENQRCKCGRLMYRNNGDGTRDQKWQGQASCQLCQGYGFVDKCRQCDGAGLVAGQKCPACCGNGVVPNKTAKELVHG